MGQTGTKPPSGTRDFLPDEVRKREHVMRVVREVYESYGFEPCDAFADYVLDDFSMCMSREL